MKKEDIILQIQLALGKPENKYPHCYAKTEDGKDNLHIWLLDFTKAAIAVYNHLEKIGVINSEK